MDMAARRKGLRLMKNRSGTYFLDRLGGGHHNVADELADLAAVLVFLHEYQPEQPSSE